jgi:L-fuconolactonase
VTEHPHPVVDAHLHLWDRARSSYDWITPDLGELYGDFLPETAAEQLLASDIDCAILVQAEDSAVDTHFMLDVAAAHDWVLGVVGWVPLDDPIRSLRLLEQWCENPLFCGIRQLTHTDARDELFERPAVVETLRLVAGAGLGFDVPNAWPRHLASLGLLATSIPDLIVVVDHLGTPPLAAEELVGWEGTIRDVAAHPNTVAKVSGLQHLPAPTLRRVWDVALDAFGPSRLMYGSDWPMTVPTGGYGPTFQRLLALLNELAASERAAILSGTARRTYRLPTTEIPTKEE